MGLVWLIAIAGPPSVLLGLGLLPIRRAHVGLVLVRSIVCRGALTTFLGAALFLATAGSSAPGRVSLFELPGLPIDLYLDRLSLLMAVLVGGLGAAVARYSVRYLKGEPTQGRFFRWLGFTLGAVLWLVLAGNLLLFALAWVLTSMGLHRLLTHYADRPVAVRAAWHKFFISRLGDCFLVTALIFTYQHFGSLEYSELFQRAAELQAANASLPWTVHLLAGLFALAAMTKSAQVPLHSWLPDTLETPTPVSALMHAGIINAGGYLLIRLSPLVGLSATALQWLALVGALTAILAATVMLTQTSIKRVLAYSTVAQMGFMLLQCGLGMFSAAFLHLLGHSCYKAFAFLSSGSVLASAVGPRLHQGPAITRARMAGIRLAALLVSVLVIGGTGLMWGWHATEGPSPLVMMAVLGLALSTLLMPALLIGSWRTQMLAVGTTVGVAQAYFLGFLVLDSYLGTSVAHLPLAWSLSTGLLTAMIVGGMLFLWWWQVELLPQRLGLVLQDPAAVPIARWRQQWYVHALNGFYSDVYLWRWLDRWIPAAPRWTVDGGLTRAHVD